MTTDDGPPDDWQPLLVPDADELLDRARAGAWDLIRSRLAAGDDAQLDALQFSQFLYDLIEREPQFTFSLLSELRRIAAQFVQKAAEAMTEAEDFEGSMSPIELSEHLRREDDQQQRPESIL